MGASSCGTLGTVPSVLLSAWLACLGSSLFWGADAWTSEYGSGEQQARVASFGQSGFRGKGWGSCGWGLHLAQWVGTGFAASQASVCHLLAL